MNTKTTQLYEYLTARNKHTQTKFEDSPAALEQMFLKGQRKFYGVLVNEHGTVMRDDDLALFYKINM